MVNEVFFDDLKIEYSESPVIQANDYYPFGLSFNGYRRENSVANKYLYNQGTGEKKFNTERITDLGLEVDMTRFRVYDPTIGRWWQTDPKPDYSQSLYSSMSNNPILYNDPFGES